MMASSARLLTNSLMKAAHSTVRICTVIPSALSWLWMMIAALMRGIVALIDEDGKRERFAVPLRRPSLILFQPASSRQPAGFVHILPDRRQFVIYRPMSPAYGGPTVGTPPRAARRRRLAIDSHRNGRRTRTSLKRMLQIEPRKV